MRRAERSLALATAVGALLLATGEVPAQVPAGGEFLVNTYTAGPQEAWPPRRAVAVTPNGDFVAVWMSGGNQDGSGDGIFAQRFGADGSRRGSEFLVNSYTTGNQLAPTVAADGRGNFVVAWQSAGQDGDGYGIFARRYANDGSGMGAEFRVNSSTTGQQGRPAATMAPTGDFVIAWDGAPGDDVFLRRFDAVGVAAGGDIRVNTSTGGTQTQASVDADRTGAFVVVWENHTGGYPPPAAISGRRFDSTGVPQGGEFAVSSTVNGTNPRVSRADGGAFVVAWGPVTAPGVSAVFARRFAPTGTPYGGDFVVNLSTTALQYRPDVAMDETGKFVVVWTAGQGPGGTVFGTRFDADAAPRGAPFQVNTGAFGIYPSLGSDTAGNFVATWTGPDGDLLGVFGQRFGGLRPAALAVDAVATTTSNGNGIFEAGESVVVAPSWRNVNGAAQTFTGVAASFSGPGSPGDPIYLVKDGTANYGTVANGATAGCAAANDCYLVATTVPSVRPVRHWDATLREDILPDAQGQSKLWALHVGDSFTDVLRSSPFYPFIEALMHNGVTAGCGPTQYCRVSPTTREQMAVFVLVSKEGAGYLPPACGAAPAFADVPVASPFCRWVEELARRGVVAGCGGGNYCPAGNVTREQMAVFVLRALDPAMNPPACGAPVFADVPATSPFCRWIEELSRRGVVAGCGGGNYCPLGHVTREQMAVFLGVTFGLTLYGP